MARGSQKEDRMKPDGPENLEWKSACLAGPCLEVARVEGGVFLRESAYPAGRIYVPVASWATFLEGVKAGKFDGIDG